MCSNISCSLVAKRQENSSYRLYVYVEKKIVFVLFELHGGLSEDGKAVSTNMWLEIGESGGTNVREADRRVGVSEDLRINPRRCANSYMCVCRLAPHRMTSDAQLTAAVHHLRPISFSCRQLNQPSQVPGLLRRV